MEIVHNQNSGKSTSLSSIRGGKQISDVLHSKEKDLLHQVAETFSIVTGGNFKKRSNIA